MRRHAPLNSTAPRLRCAVYTRKSNEEGLDQAFNSLHAQREACEAYIRSQAGEGWVILPTAYDDGGFSGGNMERPAVKRLLDDVDAGRVDIIVVYKVDRLTRSLMDFSRIVERLDAKAVSFVSVTQAFNTTSSMGRLTLNVLLSFAQFEREVTGERIRDKIAASKAKGMWMGGNPPLGYDARDRQLLVNEKESELVRHIFRRYVELSSVPAVANELNAAGFVTKRWVSRRGNALGGARFWSGGLCHILQNRLYVAEIVHRGQVHAGLHDPIVDRALFDAAQDKLAANRRRHNNRPTRAAACPLAGIIFDAEGVPMAPSFSYGRRKVIYRYYVSRSVLPVSGKKPEESGIVRRLPAATVETIVAAHMQTLLGRDAPLDWAELSKLVHRVDMQVNSLTLQLRAEDLFARGQSTQRSFVRLQERVQIAGSLSMDSSGVIHLICDLPELFCGNRTRRRTFASPSASSSKGTDVLVKALRSAHKLLRRHRLSPLAPDEHASSTAPSAQRDRRLMALGLLAPDIQRALLEGRLPANLDVSSLLREDLPISWAAQRKRLGLID